MAATLKCDTISNASSATANITLDTAGNATVGNTLAMGSSFLRNRIINGDMRIDQRNAGASVTQTTSDVYNLDRWVASGSSASKFTVQQNAGAVTPPAGFTNYLGVTSSSSYSVGTGDFFYLMQGIEGYNVSSLNFGTSNASTITVSFWVRSSLTGNFGGCLRNKISGADRGYPFTYTIAQANTWEYKSVTIAGDTTGTWASTTACSVTVCFGLGTGSTYSGTSGAWAAANLIQPTSTVSVVGTNGATFYITGVQLEVGSVATPFERLNYQQQLAQCLRYYRRYPNSGAAYTSFGLGINQSTTAINRWGFPIDIAMRVAPTVNLVNCVGWNGVVGGAASIGTSYNTVNNIDCDVTTSGLTGATNGYLGKVLIASNGYVELTGAEL